MLESSQTPAFFNPNLTCTVETISPELDGEEMAEMCLVHYLSWKYFLLSVCLCDHAHISMYLDNSSGKLVQVPRFFISRVDSPVPLPNAIAEDVLEN